MTSIVLSNTFSSLCFVELSLLSDAVFKSLISFAVFLARSLMSVARQDCVRELFEVDALVKIGSVSS